MAMHILMLILGQARTLLKKLSTGILNSFNRVVQFWNDTVLMLQVCLLARIMMLSKWHCKKISKNKDKTESFMKIHFCFGWRVQPQSFFFSK
jgi:hypothetical protein